VALTERRVLFVRLCRRLRLARELRVPFLCVCGFTCGVEQAFQTHLRRNEGAPTGAHAAVEQDGGGAAATLPPATTLPRLPPQPKRTVLGAAAPSPRRRASGGGAAAPLALPAPAAGDASAAQRTRRSSLASPLGGVDASGRRRKRSVGAEDTPREAVSKTPRRAADASSAGGADAADAAASPDAAPTTLKRMPFMQDADADETDDAAPPAKRQAARRSAGGRTSAGAAASPAPALAAPSPRLGRASRAP
jgi:hypothetical protein